MGRASLLGRDHRRRRARWPRASAWPRSSSTTSTPRSFLGAALAATSVGITARVFADLRALATVEARTVLGAAVADDVFGLRHPHGRRAHRLRGHGLDRHRARDRAVAVGLPRRRRPSAGTRLAPPAFDWLRQERPLGRNAGGARARVHPRASPSSPRRRSSRRSSGRSSPGSRWLAARLEGADRARARAGRPPVHPGVLPPDRDRRSRCRQFFSPDGARDRRRAPGRVAVVGKLVAVARSRSGHRATSGSSASECSPAARSG